MKKERLQKVLSQAGLGSRREMERWIEQGMVKVDGAVATIGMQVDEEARIAVKGKLIDNPLKRNTRTRIILYHKPVGEISSRYDPKHNRTIFDNLPKIRNGKWIQVGRLDINTSGLMVFTNNGTLANTLMHPKHGFEREYAVRVCGEVEQPMLDNLKKGVVLEDGMARFESIAFLGGEGINAWYHVTLKEGRNREVRRLWKSQGVEVSRLIRIRFGPFDLPRFLKRKDCYELKEEQVQAILKGFQ